MTMTEVSYRSNLNHLPASNSQSMSLPSRTLNELPSTSSFAWLRLAASRAATPPVAVWPEPERSIGQSCSPLGKLKCWEVIGPALSISNSILRAVKELLDPRAEYLHEAEPKPCFIAFGVYMIGLDERKANPTLLISCERKSPRQKAVKLVRESTILKENRGVRLAESPRPPLCSLSPILLSPPEDEDDKGSLGRLLDGVLYWSPSDVTCGISLYTKESHDNNTVYAQKATIGGIVSLQGGLFGLSAAHGFVNHHNSSPPPDDDISFEISFDDWVEVDDMYQEVENLDNEETLPSTAPILDEIVAVEGTDMQTRLSSNIHEDMKLPFGFLHSSSFKNDDIGLDWALIKVEQHLLPSLNTISVGLGDSVRMGTSNRLINIKQIAEGGPVGACVLAITGMSGIIHGHMSQSPTFMIIPYSKSLQEMWTIRLDGEICRGDSGSWVVDSANGNLYGQIVAGCPGSRIAYIVPAQHIAQDIKDRLGSQIMLPQNSSGLAGSDVLRVASSSLGTLEAPLSRLKPYLTERTVSEATYVTSPIFASGNERGSLFGARRLRSEDYSASESSRSPYDSLRSSKLVSASHGSSRSSILAAGSLGSSRNSMLAPDSLGNPIPLDAKWTRISRTLVSAEVLNQDGRRYEARPDFVAVLGVLSRDEIEEYAVRSKAVREARKARQRFQLPQMPPRPAEERHVEKWRRHVSFDDAADRSPSPSSGEDDRDRLPAQREYRSYPSPIPPLTPSTHYQPPPTRQMSPPEPPSAQFAPIPQHLIQASYAIGRPPYAAPGAALNSPDPGKGYQALASRTPISTMSTINSIESEIPIGGFGSSPSDIIIVVTFARRLYRQCRNVGGEYLELSREVRGLHIVLKHLKYEAEAPESILNRDHSMYRRELAPAVGGCDYALRQLDESLQKYHRLGHHEDGPGRLWAKFRFGSNELDELGSIRMKLINHKTTITIFLDRVQLHESAVLDIQNGQLHMILDKVDKIAVRMGQRAGSIMTTYEDDDKEVWKQFRSELVAEGFSSDVLQQHKDVLRAYIRDIDQNGLLDEFPQSTNSERAKLETSPINDAAGKQMVPREDKSVVRKEGIDVSNLPLPELMTTVPESEPPLMVNDLTTVISTTDLVLQSDLKLDHPGDDKRLSPSREDYKTSYTPSSSPIASSIASPLVPYPIRRSEARDSDIEDEHDSRTQKEVRARSRDSTNYSDDQSNTKNPTGTLERVRGRGSKRRRDLTAVGISGAAVSLLSVLTEAAENL